MSLISIFFLFKIEWQRLYSSSQGKTERLIGLQKQHIEPLFKERDDFAWIYDLDWQGQMISFDAKEIKMQWTTPSFLKSTIVKEDLTLVPGKKAVVK